MQHFKPFTVEHRGILASIFLIFASLFLTGMAQAAPLTDEKVQSFIDTKEELRSFSDAYPGLEEASDKERDMTRPFSSVLGSLDAYPGARGELEAIVEKHGFDSVEEWAKTGDRIVMAELAINYKDMTEDNRAMMDRMMSAGNNQNVSAQALQMARQAKAQMKAIDTVPDEDIQAVRPFMKQLDPEEY
ncbi:hypothetical protein [Marinobacter sp. NFXS9]|uniref:hypothetical protein n=1 Tax=Marinobacter sp. NFXS9 TaxID=2818433 RepID=UPI0032DEBFC3